MNEACDGRNVLVIPCSGIGKVQGLIAREATYEIVDGRVPQGHETVCLALLVSGDEEIVSKVRRCDCVTIDGCPKLCAQKNVELAGGNVVEAVRVVDWFRNHTGAQPGNATTLTDDGWKMVDEIAAGLCGRLCAGGK